MPRWGGCKGLYSAGLPAQLERDHEIRVDEHFDLIVGTSTGALIACGLAIGLRPRELVQLFRSKGYVIFPQSWWRDITHAFHSKHDQEQLRSALKEIFGDKTLADCKRRLVVSAYWHDQDIPRLLKTPHSSRYFRDNTTTHAASRHPSMKRRAVGRFYTRVNFGSRLEFS